MVSIHSNLRLDYIQQPMVFIDYILWTWEHYAWNSRYMETRNFTQLSYRIEESILMNALHLNGRRGIMSSQNIGEWNQDQQMHWCIRSWIGVAKTTLDRKMPFSSWQWLGFRFIARKLPMKSLHCSGDTIFILHCLGNFNSTLFYLHDFQIYSDI